MPATAVGYTRRSTDKQETSIAEQTNAIQQYADDKGYKIIRWYCDDAISGDDTENRLGFQQMLADAQTNHDYESIICWDQSRFGRFSPQEAGHWTYLFSKAGVGLVTVDKGPVDWNDFTGWLTYSVNQHSKHDFLKQLSKDVARGQLEAIKKGSWIGQPPYGYRVEGQRKNKRLVIECPGKVKIVQRIFHEYVQEGRSMGDIARRLAEDNVVAPGGTGRPWRYDSVRCILENPAYAGDYASGRYAYGKYNTIRGGEVTKGSKRRGRNPESTWTVRRDNHESIIDRETFEKARAILAKGKGRSHFTPETNPFVLSGLPRCGKCGSPMWGDTVGPRRFYRCGNWQTNGAKACPGTKVNEDVLLESLAGYLEEWLGPDAITIAVRGVHRMLKSEKDLPEAFHEIKKLICPPVKPKQDRTRLEKQVAKLKAEEAKARLNLSKVDAEFIPDVQKRIRELEAEREGIEKELEESKPIPEKDINAVATEVFIELSYLTTCCRSLTKPEPPHCQDDDPEVETVLNSLRLTRKDAARETKRVLNHVAQIVVHSETVGTGTATRHNFVKGEIVFKVRGKQEGLEPSSYSPLLIAREITIAFFPRKAA